jgi:hypothetical protein
MGTERNETKPRFFLIAPAKWNTFCRLLFFLWLIRLDVLNGHGFDVSNLQKIDVLALLNTNYSLSLPRHLANASISVSDKDIKRQWDY